MRQGGPAAWEVGGDDFGCGAVGGLVVLRVRGAGVWLSVAMVGLFSFGSLTLAGSAAAALPSGCSEAASTVTCSFSFTGAAQSFTVPSGVNSITVTAFGAQGGGDAGGLGGEAQAVFAVSPGAALEVLVGGQGGPATGAQAGAAGGFNGGGGGRRWRSWHVGGASGPGGSGGGGASDVRTGPCASSLSCGLAARVLVGGGGGGASGSSARVVVEDPRQGVQEPPTQVVAAGRHQSTGGSGGAGGSVPVISCAAGNGTAGGVATEDSGGPGGAGGSAHPWGFRSRAVQVLVVAAAATGVVAAVGADARLWVLGVEGVAPALARLTRRSRRDAIGQRDGVDQLLPRRRRVRRR